MEGLEFSLADTEQEQLTGHVTDSMHEICGDKSTGDVSSIVSNQEVEKSASEETEERSSSRKLAQLC